MKSAAAAQYAHIPPPTLDNLGELAYTGLDLAAFLAIGILLVVAGVAIWKSGKSA